MKRSIKDYAILGAKGMAMGAADIIPGVSGGTVAFITGIYQELLSSIKSINLDALKTLFSKGISATWQQVNGTFLVALFTGIALSFSALSHAVTHLLETQPIFIWSLFFGLIATSCPFILKRAKKWKPIYFLPLIIGVAIGYLITAATPSTIPSYPWFIYLSGMIASCAMILPGISGSFILLLLGQYEFMLQALKDMDLLMILIFVAGCATGLILFSNVLTWLFSKYHDITITVLTGFMVGSLNKVWPWKKTLEVYINSKGIEKPLVQENVLPTEFLQTTGLEPQWGIALIAAIIGSLLIILLEKKSVTTDNQASL